MSAVFRSATGLRKSDHLIRAQREMLSPRHQWLKIQDAEHGGCGLVHVHCPITQGDNRTPLGQCTNCKYFVGIPPMSGALLCASESDV